MSEGCASGNTGNTEIGGGMTSLTVLQVSGNSMFIYIDMTLLRCLLIILNKKIVTETI